MGSMRKDGNPNANTDSVTTYSSIAHVYESRDGISGPNQNQEERTLSDDGAVDGTIERVLEAKVFKSRKAKESRYQHGRMKLRTTNDKCAQSDDLDVQGNGLSRTIDSMEDRADQNCKWNNYEKCLIKFGEISSGDKRVIVQKKLKKVDSPQQMYNSTNLDKDHGLKGNFFNGLEYLPVMCEKNSETVLPSLHEISKSNSASQLRGRSTQSPSETQKQSSNRGKSRSKGHVQNGQRLPRPSSSLSTLYASRKVPPSNSEFAVLKLVNISWNLGISDIVSYFNSVKIAIGHLPPHYTHAIHIIMNRDSGKTHSECFVEFPTYYDALTAMEMHPRGFLKGRMVTTQWSSQCELFNILFPNQTVFPTKSNPGAGRQSTDECPPCGSSGRSCSSEDGTSSQPRTASQGAGGVFLQREEINAILVICRNYKLHFSRKCAERPFENIISVITKIPWDNYNLISPTHRDHLFEMLKLGLGSLKTHLEKCDVSMDETLFTRMLRAGLCAPLFTERQKKTLLSVAEVECIPDMVQFIHTSSNERCSDVNTLPSSKTPLERSSLPPCVSSGATLHPPKHDSPHVDTHAGSFLQNPSRFHIQLGKQPHDKISNVRCSLGSTASDCELKVEARADHDQTNLFSSWLNSPRLADDSPHQTCKRSNPNCYSPGYPSGYNNHRALALNRQSNFQVLESSAKLSPLAGADEPYELVYSAQEQLRPLLPTNSFSPTTPPVTGSPPHDARMSNEYEKMRSQTQVLLSRIKSLELKLRKGCDRCKELTKRAELAESKILHGVRGHSGVVGDLERKYRELESELFAKERLNVQLELRLRKIQEIITLHAEDFSISQELRAEIEDQTITGPWGGFLGGNSILSDGVKDLWNAEFPS